MRRRVVGVVGAGECDEATYARAREVGRLLAEAGCVVATGGLGGVMTAAAEGARGAGGLVLGILPGSSPDEANPFVDVAVATGMGDARNVVLCNTAEAFVAVAGSLGTLSEIAFALKRKKRVVGLGTWSHPDLVIELARDAEDAVRRALSQG